MTGIVYFGFKSPEEKIVVRSTACDMLINRYLAASSEEDFDLIMKMHELAGEVPNNSHARNDANCQFIQMYSALMFGDLEEAMELARHLQTLINDGLPLDARLPVFGSIGDMISIIQIAIDATEYVEYEQPLRRRI